MGSRQQAGLKAEARAETIEDLVALVLRGHVRIPSFQRGLRWTSDDVVSLFDSVYRGYPIGSLLLRRGHADASRLRLGPLAIDAPAMESALWVVDGQQRLTALTAGLARPFPIPTAPTDAYVVYFDAETENFVAPPKNGIVSETWVPVAQLLDAASLTEWVFHWSGNQSDRLRRTVFAAGSRIRQYNVPMYVVETQDDRLLREIFYRINKSGRPLKWDEVHDALFGKTGTQPSSIRELAEELKQFGMGPPDQSLLLSCLLASRGLDVTRTVADHYRRDRDVLRNAVREAVPALGSVLSFLRAHAEIPHLRLLPRSTPLPVLTRFFAIFPEPTARTLDLMTRWTWRLILRGSSFDERTLLRRAISSVVIDDEEGSVQALLGLVSRKASEFHMPARYDARAADSRLALLAMVSLGPLDPITGSEIKVADAVEHHDIRAFRRIVSSGSPVATTPANRAILPGSGNAKNDLLRARFRHDGGKILNSHGVSEEARRQLERGMTDAFLNTRSRAVVEAAETMFNRLAAWSLSDRPSLQYVLRNVRDDQ